MCALLQGPDRDHGLQHEQDQVLLVPLQQLQQLAQSECQRQELDPRPEECELLLGHFREDLERPGAGKGTVDPECNLDQELRPGEVQRHNFRWAPDHQQHAQLH